MRRHVALLVAVFLASGAIAALVACGNSTPLDQPTAAPTETATLPVNATATPTGTAILPVKATATPSAAVDPVPALTPTPAPDVGLEFAPPGSSGTSGKDEGITISDQEPSQKDGGSTEPVQGQTYTWEDGDRTLAAYLQTDLVVDDGSADSPRDVVAANTGGGNIVKGTGGRSDGGTLPVFRSESGTLMTLPGGVLLVLDPAWSEAQVSSFFADQRHQARSGVRAELRSKRLLRGDRAGVPVPGACQHAGSPGRCGAIQPQLVAGDNQEVTGRPLPSPAEVAVARGAGPTCIWRALHFPGAVGPMIRMFRLARLAPVVVVAILCLFVALRYAIAQTTPAAPTIDSVTSGDERLTVAWTAPAGETGIIAYDVRHIETSADETDDANWTEMDNAWTSDALQYTIAMLTNGTQYDVQVRAVNSNGDGDLVRHGRSARRPCPLRPSIPCAPTTAQRLSHGSLPLESPRRSRPTTCGTSPPALTRR